MNKARRMTVNTKNQTRVGVVRVTWKFDGLNMVDRSVCVTLVLCLMIHPQAVLCTGWGMWLWAQRRG